MNRPSVAPLFGLVASLLLGAPAPAQNDQENPHPPPPGAAAEVSLEPKEIDRIARLLNDYEKARAKGGIKGTKKAHRIHGQLLSFLARIKQGGRDPLKAVSAWWQIFSSEKYRRFSGRIGRQANKKCLFNRMGKQLKVLFQLHVPGTYRARTPAPLVLCLHPREGKFSGADYLKHLWSTKELQAGPILLAPEFPTDQPAGARWSERKMLYASMGVIGRQVLNDYNVDWNRWFLDGYRDGAVEAWRLAGQYADTFAGVIIRGGLPPEGTRLNDFVNTAFLLVGVPGLEMDPEKADALAAKMKEHGIDVAVANLSETPKPRQERDAFRAIAPQVLEFLRKVRSPYPEKIDWSVKENHTRRCFYVKSTGELEAEAVKDKTERQVPPSFQVTVDRASNKLIFTCHRIQSFRVFLNDRILDLDKDVTFEVNGKVVYNGRLERSFKELYDEFTSSGDWTRIYPCSRTVDVPLEQ